MVLQSWKEVEEEAKASGDGRPGELGLARLEPDAVSGPVQADRQGSGASAVVERALVLPEAVLDADSDPTGIIGAVEGLDGVWLR